ncbi:MAG: molecular chaperone TorD family protein [Shimia sp.]|uniref:TorD/DmsD family molecular chaperone n=1 Tax=Shimia sp. TaxID=1954381 RepID=UPI0025D09902|nr:molecular chaperone TorD family protein [Shimia sp.]MCH2067858.1 molecular chaperone TorD family protein [Shimia sp.]
MSQAVTNTQVAEEDLLRADLYDFLAALLANPPSKDLLQHASALSGDDSDLGKAISTLARVAKATNATAVESEFNALFIGLGRGELMPFASYYLTGFLNEKPLASLRAGMAALRITRAPNVYEPEDNIASLLEMMAGMIRGRFGAPVPLQKQKDFFFTHIAAWAEHFFSDLEAAQNSVFYAPVGTVGKAFLEIETQAFRMGAD